MTRYRTKPTEIDAERWDGTASGATPIIDWVLQNDGTAHFVGENEEHHLRNADQETWDPFIVIYTLEGPMRCRPGWWVIRGTRGEFYPCAPDPFADKYEVTS